MRSEAEQKKQWGSGNPQSYFVKTVVVAVATVVEEGRSLVAAAAAVVAAVAAGERRRRLVAGAEKMPAVLRIERKTPEWKKLSQRSSGLQRGFD